MAILVTGGAGYIGSVTVETLLERGHEVVVVDDLRDGNVWAVLEPAWLFTEDFGNKNFLNAVFNSHRIEAVIHFAASASVPLSMTEPKIFFENNVANGINLLDVMRQFDCRKIIFSSSAAVYGEPHYVPITENHPTKPINAYGESKLMFEKILEWYHRAYGFQVNIFRYFNAAGASQKLGEARIEESHLIPLAIDVALGKREKLFIYGNDYLDVRSLKASLRTTCVRDFVHVLDIARAHVLALDNLGKKPFEVYNLGNGKGYSVLEVVEMVERVTGKKVNYEFVDRRAGDPACLVADYDKAKRDLGWEPELGLEEMVGSAVEWRKDKLPLPSIPPLDPPLMKGGDY